MSDLSADREEDQIETMLYLYGQTVVNNLPDGLIVGNTFYPFMVDCPDWFRNPDLEWLWVCRRDGDYETATELGACHFGGYFLGLNEIPEGKHLPSCCWVAVGVKEETP